MRSSPRPIFADLVHEVLKEEYKKNSNTALTARQISEIILERHKDYCQDKMNRSENILLKGKTVDSARGDIAFQIKAQILVQQERIKRRPNIEIDVSVKPRLFIYNPEKVQPSENKTLDRKKSNEEEDEESLYPILQEYLFYYSDYKIFSRHISHQGSFSRASGANKWLHPDLVGLQDMHEDYESHEIQNIIKYLSYKRFKFWSFEVKPYINAGNVRECFFQAVANSCWANFAYLVATKIIGEEADKELRWLANLHGVGFIRLDKEDSSNSSIVIPAKERKEVDWDMFYRLVGSNKKYEENYLKLANEVLESKRRKKLDIKEWGIKKIELDE